MSKKEKRVINPIITVTIIILLVLIFSSVLSLLNIEGSKTTIDSGTLETSIVLVNNIFIKEGISNFFNNIIINFGLLNPLFWIIISLMATGILRASGFLKHIASFLRKFKFNIVTYMVVFIGIISSFIGEYSYIIFLPIVAVLYKYLNKSPLLGILTMFLAITLGYGTGIFYNYDNHILGTLTQISATLDVDQTYRYTLYSNIYIMVVSTITITIGLSFLINKYLLPKFEVKEVYEDELVISKKGLLFSVLTGLVVIAGIVLLIIPTNILLDTTQTTFVAKLFSPTSPLYSSFMFLYLIGASLVGMVYGFLSKNFKNNHQFCKGFAIQFDKVGYLFVFMFLLSILIGVVEWSNLGVVITTKLIDLLATLNFSGFVLIITTFIFVVLMTIFMPSLVGKWTIISPILIPLFMRANMSPDFAQFLFQVSSSIGSIFTIMFPYLLITLGLMLKYDDENIGLFSLFKKIMPVVLLTVGLWLIIILCWYVVGLPLGIGTTITM